MAHRQAGAVCSTARLPRPGACKRMEGLQPALHHPSCGRHAPAPPAATLDGLQTERRAVAAGNMNDDWFWLYAGVAGPPPVPVPAAAIFSCFCRTIQRPASSLRRASRRHSAEYSGYHRLKRPDARPPLQGACTATACFIPGARLFQCAEVVGAEQMLSLKHFLKWRERHWVRHSTRRPGGPRMPQSTSRAAGQFRVL